MSNNITPDILLIGAGNMAVQYAKVLKSLQANFITIGNGKEGVKRFKEKSGCTAIHGGIESYLKVAPNLKSSYAIVATPALSHFNVCKSLINAGLKNILVEKPGCLNINDAQELASLCDLNKVNLLIAYNRRFFESVSQLIKLTNEDGGINSLNFEFTERSHIIRTLNKDEIIRNHWIVANSSHVIDTAFFIIGNPKTMNTSIHGTSDWHSSGAVFIGNGVSDNEIPFSYHSDWESPGGWRIEAMTSKARYFLQPMEELYIQQLGENKKESYQLNKTLDIDFKPGLYKMVEAYLNSNFTLFPTIKEQIDSIKLYYKIGGYEA